MPSVWCQRLGTVVVATVLSVLLIPGTATAQEPSLQQIFDSEYGPGRIRVPADETGQQTFTAGAGEHRIIVEFAGNGPVNTFGWYPVNNPGDLHRYSRAPRATAPQSWSSPMSTARSSARLRGCGARRPA